MIGHGSGKSWKDKIPSSHRVKMIQNRREPRRPMTELGVSCRLGIPSARLTAKRIISPSNHSPRLSLDCRALYSRHIISLSALLALAPHLPLLLCSAGCIISSSGPGLLLSRQGHKSTSYVSLGHPRIRVFHMNWRSTLRFLFSQSCQTTHGGCNRLIQI